MSGIHSESNVPISNIFIHPTPPHRLILTSGMVMSTFLWIAFFLLIFDSVQPILLTVHVQEKQRDIEMQKCVWSSHLAQLWHTYRSWVQLSVNLVCISNRHILWYYLDPYLFQINWSLVFHLPTPLILNILLPNFILTTTG